MSESSFAGFDPYDALRGRNVPKWMRSNRRLRQIAIQLRKRLPLPTAALYGVTPFVMAKTAGSMLTAAARNGDSLGIAAAMDALLEADGNLGAGAWGYEFDVQTRWAFYPAGSPNLIATVFVGRGLGTAGIAGAQPDIREGLSSAAGFLLNRLYAAGDLPSFRYTLTSEQLVHNANLLGAGLVAMEGCLSGHCERVEQAVDCALTSVTAQREDGSWPYGDDASLGWSDTFHTAYNLDGLLQVWLASGDVRVRDSLDSGVEQWTQGFFGGQGEPHYYMDKGYPYDVHGAGTAIDVAARLATWGFETGDLAERVAIWTRGNLIDSTSGATYYQKHRFWTDKRHFVRWGDAHWALGCSSLALMRAGRRDPLEAAVALASGVVDDAG